MGWSQLPQILHCTSHFSRVYTVLIICFDLIYLHFKAVCCRISSESLKLPHFGSATSRPPLVLRALGGPVAPPLDLEGCRRFKLTVKTLGAESVQTELKQVMMWQCFKVAIMAIPQIRPLKHRNLADLCFWRTWAFHVLHLGLCQWTYLPRYIDDFPFFSQRSLSRRGSDGSWEVLGVPAEWSQEEVADLYAEFIRSLHHDYMSRKDGSITWKVVLGTRGNFMVLLDTLHG